MANNQYVNKVVYDGNTLIDLTQDTVDAAASQSEILNGKTAYVNGVKLTGTMANNDGNNVTVSGTSGTTIPAGYYDGSGKAVIDATSASALTANNIRQGVTILGVVGTLSAEDGLTVGPITATPMATAQTITAASQELDYITQVTVNAIPYVETDNAAGGRSVVIGNVA